MKIKLWVLPFVLACSSAAYADCTADVAAIAPRLASTSADAGTPPDMDAMRRAFDLLTNALGRCDDGDEAAAANLLTELDALLRDMGR